MVTIIVSWRSPFYGVVKTDNEVGDRSETSGDEWFLSDLSLVSFPIPNTLLRYPTVPGVGVSLSL